MTPAEYGKLIADETEKWAKVVKAAGMKADSALVPARYFLSREALP